MLYSPEPPALPALPEWRSHAGARLAVVPCPGAGRASLLVEVAAGSHDEPAAWPGLAHLLEHCLFLGGQRYPAGERLMPFVQACGGQLNASTTAHSTRYHFEVPAEQLEAAALRLFDMLAQPLLEAAAVQAECRVLDAEYQARSADPWQQALAGVFQAMPAGHPLQAFVAGNAASLPGDQPALLEALEGFHRQFYRAANCRLLLLGPGSRSQLQALAESLAGLLPAGAARPPVPQRPLLPLQGRHWRLQQRQQQVYLGLVVQGPVNGFAQACQWLKAFLERDGRGSVQQQLHALGLLQRWQLHWAYRQAGQALLVLRVEGAADVDDCARIRAGVLVALAQWQQQAPWTAARAALGLQRRWQLATLAPLALGAFWLEQDEAPALQPDEAARACLRQMLAGCSEDTLISLQADPAADLKTRNCCGFPLMIEAAALPALACPPLQWADCDNPLLATQALPPGDWPASITRLEAEQGPAQLLLRWQWPQGCPVALPALLQQRLRALQGAAAELGMELQSSAPSGGWQWRCNGPAGLLPGVLKGVLDALDAPAELEREWPQAERLLQAERAALSGQMPLRRLLQQLPQRLRAALPDAAPARALWSGAQCLGLLQAPAAMAAALAGLLQQLPGRAVSGLPASAWPAGLHWCDPVPLVRSGDHALLLFCPCPPGVPERAWRGLGLWLGAAFYQRMREQLQLGYGVLAAVRQIEGIIGLCFAIQSPDCPAAGLLEHIDGWLAEMQPDVIDEPSLPALRGGVRAQLDPAQLSAAAWAELHWQARLAGRPLLSPVEGEGLSLAELRQAMAALRARSGGWVLLAN